LAATRPRPLRYRRWQDEEARSPIAGEETLFKYRLVWADNKDAGRAAYQAEISRGDIVLNYRGQWLRVLATRPTDGEDTVYDAVLMVEPA
jgi:hypothetical protein